jgi:hypothetical protein
MITSIRSLGTILPFRRFAKVPAKSLFGIVRVSPDSSLKCPAPIGFEFCGLQPQLLRLLTDPD